MEAEESAFQRNLKQVQEDNLLCRLEEKKKLAVAYRELKSNPAFQELILKHFLEQGLQGWLKRQYAEDDEAGNEAKREVHGRICLQNFLDKIETEAAKAESYVNTYNDLRDSKA